MSEHVVAGWYPAPDNPNLVRYWDGEMWTDGARPAPGQRPSTAGRQPTGGTTTVQNSKQIRALLLPGERIEEGFTSPAKAGLRKQWAVATDQRLIMLFPDSFFREKYTKIIVEYNEITKLTMTARGDSIRVERKGQSFRFFFGSSQPPPSYFSQGFVDYVRGRMAQPEDLKDLTTLPRPAPTTPFDDDRLAPSVPDLAGQLAQLGDLRRQGVLTDAEFTAAKRRLIEEDWD